MDVDTVKRGPRYVLVPITMREANDFVSEHHRHSDTTRGMKFAVGAGRLNPLFVSYGVIGVAICGRPVSRHLDDEWTLEVTRLCVEIGHENACSFLYAACRRIGMALGYRRVITYTLASESGSSLRGAGWKVLAERPATKGWDRPSRPRVAEYRSAQRLLWEAPA